MLAVLLMCALGLPAYPVAAQSDSPAAKACVRQALKLGLPHTRKIRRQYNQGAISIRQVAGRVSTLRLALPQDLRRGMRQIERRVLKCERLNPPPQTPTPEVPPEPLPDDATEREDGEQFDSLPTSASFAPFEVVPLFIGDRLSPKQFSGWSFETFGSPAIGSLHGAAPYLRYRAPGSASTNVSIPFRAVSNRNHDFDGALTLTPQPQTPPPPSSRIGTFPISKLHLYLPGSVNPQTCSYWLGIRRTGANRELTFLIRDFDHNDYQVGIRTGLIPGGTPLPSGVESWFELPPFGTTSRARTIRVLADDTGQSNGTVDVRTTCASSEFAFSAGHELTTLSSSTVGARQQLFFVAPPNLTNLSFAMAATSAVTFSSPVSGSSATTNPAHSIAVPLVLAENWNPSTHLNERTFTVSFQGTVSIRGTNFPLVLATSAATARELNGGFVIHRGKLFNHRFQADLHDQIRDLLTDLPPPNTWLPDFSSWFSQFPDAQFTPDLHLLFGVNGNWPYTSAVSALRAAVGQNINPNDFYAGAPAWWPPAGEMNPSNLSWRWDRYQMSSRPWGAGPGVGAGGYMPTFFQVPGDAADLVRIDHPMNPFKDSPFLTRQLIAGSLFPLQMATHSEFGGWGPGYAGNYYFSMRDYADVYRYLVDRASPQVQRSWTEALKNLLYYHYTYGSTVGTANQTFYFLLPLMKLGLFSPDPLDRILVEERLSRTLGDQSSSGYFQEAYGDDGNYNFDSRRDLIYIFNLDRSSPYFLETLLPAIRKSYHLNQRMWAPEPLPFTGRLGSSSSFHRTPWPAPNFWVIHDSGIDELLPEAALFTNGPAWNPLNTPANRKNDWRNSLNSQRTSLLSTSRPDLTDVGFLSIGGGAPRYRHALLPPLTNPVHPALSPSTPIISSDSEYLTVKRDYYATLFTGKPGMSDQPTRLLSYYYMVPPPDNGENTGGVYEYNRAITLNGSTVGNMLPVAHNGGGLSLLHHPLSGSQLLSMNWSPLVQHGVVLTLPEDGRRLFAAYNPTTREIISSGDPVVVVRGKLLRPQLTTGSSATQILSGGDIAYERRYTFRKDRIDVLVTVRNEGGSAQPIGRLVEVIPVPVKTEGQPQTITLGTQPPVAMRPNLPSNDPNYDAAFATLWPPTPRRTTAFSVSIRRDQERPFQIILDKPRVVDAQMNSLHIPTETSRIGRVEIDMEGGVSLPAGASRTLSYTLIP